MPYQRKLLNGNKVLFYAIYSGVTFSEARQRLLRTRASKTNRSPRTGIGKAEKKKAKNAK